jgi:cell wall assembly regulator SMI1
VKKPYNNKFINTKEILTDEDISDIEKKYKFTFPKDIREHYLTYNGGEPERCVFVDEDGDEYVVQRFIPIKHKNKRGGGNLETTLDMLRVDEILPNWLIPFAEEPGGDLFCFSVDEDEEGAIYYWSHEYEYGEDPEEYVTYLAESLKEFIEAMVEDE